MKFSLALIAALIVFGLNISPMNSSGPLENRREVASIDELYNDSSDASQEVDCVQCRLEKQQQEYLASFNTAYLQNQQILSALGQGNISSQLPVYQQMDQITAMMMAQTMPQMSGNYFSTPVLNQLYMQNQNVMLPELSLPTQSWGSAITPVQAAEFSFIQPQAETGPYQRFGELQGFDFSNSQATLGIVQETPEMI